MSFRKTALRPLARRVGRTGFARSAIADQADLEPFRERPTARLVTGLILIALSFVVGWPGVTAFGVAAIWTGEPLFILIGGPFAYGLSWAIWGVGMALTGPDTYKYGRIFLRWLVRWFVERHADDPLSSPTDATPPPATEAPLTDPRE
jgi:hypothetical protein